MIIIRYKGGLGNQMFIYAMHMALKTHYQNTDILADTTRYELHNEHNGFELPAVWGINPEQASREKIKEISPYLVPAKWMLKAPEFIRAYLRDNWQHKYYYRRLQDENIKARYSKQSDHNIYEPGFFELDAEEDCYVDGLWQNIMYFDTIKDDIQKAFRIVDENGYSRFENRYSDLDKSLVWQITADDTISVSVHVRRGDFSNSKFDICGRKYYDSAIERMNQELGETIHGSTDKIHYYFFTDDSQFVEREYAHIANKTIVKHDVSTSILDMDMMSRCDHHIISNSTFSWWGAYLGSEKGITIAPSFSLYNHGVYYPLSVLDNWIQIDVR